MLTYGRGGRVHVYLAEQFDMYADIGLCARFEAVDQTPSPARLATSVSKMTSTSSVHK